MHRLLISVDDHPDPADLFRLTGEEARHAVKVRRARVGDAAELLDGQGRRARGIIRSIEPGRRGDPAVLLDIEGLSREPPDDPRIEVWSAAPKGDRLTTMIEQLGQVGAAAWVPVDAERAVVDPRPGKLGRLERIALSSIKQSGRAWALEIHPTRGVEQVFEPANGVSIVLADPGGGREMPALSGTVRLLIGPEGGWSPAELARARESGIATVSLGPHVMRIGTAAVVATALAVSATRGVR